MLKPRAIFLCSCSFLLRCVGCWFTNTILGTSTSHDDMRLRYESAPDVAELLSRIVDELRFSYIPKNSLYCFRSYGSKAGHVLARVHSLPRIWQQALGEQPRYAVEVLSEQYDSLSTEQKEKILIHELLHIPRSFGGGFRHHKDWVTRKRVESLYLALRESRGSAGLSVQGTQGH
jgi:predicted metallopeptidase